MGTAVCVFEKMVPYSAPAADAMILRMLLHTNSMMPLMMGTKYSGFLGFRWNFTEKMDLAGLAYGMRHRKA